MNSCDLIDFIYSFVKEPRNIIYIITSNVQKIFLVFWKLVHFVTTDLITKWNGKKPIKNKMSALTNTDVLHSPWLFENKAIAS